MKSLIVTVAGTATRFNKDNDSPTLKCLYHQGDYKKSLLYLILDKSRELDEYIIVGGYLYDVLNSFIEEFLAEFKSKIKLVYNKHYSDYGSGYSLLKGIQAVSSKAKEIIFVEGDLAFCKDSYDCVLNSQKSIITYNNHPIEAKKSVVFYSDVKKKMHYIYDLNHSILQINEPFTAIYNSAQLWKFANIPTLMDTISALSDEQRKGTNLEIVQGYFDQMNIDEVQAVEIKEWMNCNTIFDYKEYFK